MLREQYEAEHLDTEAEALDAAIEALEIEQLPTADTESAYAEGWTAAESKYRAMMSDGDCISRQAAIDAMSVVNDSICGQQAIDALCALPSAQPEIIRCECCKYWDTYPSSTAAPLYHKCNAGVVAHLYTKAEGFCSRAIRRHDE